MGSSVPAQAGDFGFALQSAKIGAGGSFVPGSYTWYRAEANSVRMDLIQDDQVLPPEVNPNISPRGAYKDGKYGAGQADMLPRLEHAMGILLFGLMGDVSSISGVDADLVTVATAWTHVFRFATPAYKIPWMAIRRLVPASGGTGQLGDTIFDAKLTNLRITVPGRGKVGIRATFVGRDVDQAEDPTWTWDQDYEDPTSTPAPLDGFVKIEGTSFPITAAVIEVDNGVSTPAQERVIGSPSPDDFIPLYRTATVRFVYKWANDGLYKSLRNGGSGLTWDELPKIFKTVGSNRALEISVPAPLKITGSHPYDLRLRVNAMTIAPDGPIELAGAQLLQQAFTATALVPVSGDYLNFVLVNKHTSYTFAYTV